MLGILWVDKGTSCVRIISKFTCNKPNMLTSSNGNIFQVTGALLREFTGHR